MNKKNNKEFLSELIVGLFMIAVLGLLVYFTAIISGVDLLGRKRNLPLTVLFDNVGGLKEKDAVVYRGMNIGSVKTMELAGDKVKVALAVNEEIPFKQGYSISVTLSSMLGGNQLSIESGEGAPLPPSEPLVGLSPQNWMKDLGVVIANLKAATEGHGIENILHNLESASAAFKSIAGRIEDGKGTIGKLLADDSTLYSDLSTAISNLKSVTSKIDAGQNSLGRLLNDDGTVYADVRSTMNNLKTLSDRVQKGEGTIGKLFSSDETLYADLQTSLANLKRVTERIDKGEGTLGKLMTDDAIATNLLATVANFKQVSDRLSKGEGTLGKLSSDDALYNDIHGLIQDVRQTVDNFRDTMPITAFTSLLVGGL